MLGSRVWLHWSSLFGPLLAYNVTLKLIRMSRLGELATDAAPVGLLFSDVAFNLGFALVWLGVLSLTRHGAAVVSMHLAAVLYGVVTTSAHRYFLTTGTVLDAGLVTFAAERYDEVRPVMASETPWLTFMLVVGYLGFGPLLITRLVPRAASRAAPTGGGLFVVVGLTTVTLSAIVVPTTISRSFARDPLLHLVISANHLRAESVPSVETAALPPSGGRLLVRDGLSPQNVVVVVLESTGASVATPYRGRFAATPFLDELAKKGLLVERAYTTVPHTSKALVSIVCGIEPRPTRELVEAQPGRIPATCLPELFGGAGYRTVFFEAATEAFEDRRDLVENFGFEDFYPGESLDNEGFELANYFGVEDAALLAPSRGWLERARHESFFALYLTNTAHHDYLAPRRYGLVDFVEDDEHNRYLNAVRYQDFFLRDLYRQFEELGLVESTVFVVVGDHGEAFGEHVRRKHDDVLYEETVRVPFLLVGGPSRSPSRVSGPASLIDILPTAVDASGFDIVGGSYPGRSVLRPFAARTLWLSCFNDLRCLASVRGFEKYIHFFGDEPDAIFDLSVDPAEASNLAAEMPETVNERRRAVLEWRSRMLAFYH